MSDDSTLSKIIFYALVLFAVAVIVLSVYGTINYNKSLPDSVGDSFNKVTNIVIKFLNPILGFLLDLNEPKSDNSFIKVLAFILVSIIVISTLDSINIFEAEEDNRGYLVNFIVGIIVATIGVRYMPSDLWASLTAPSSAFVATILVGTPFLALFIVTFKIKSRLAIKLVWMFYIIFMSALIFGAGQQRELNTFSLIYSIFFVLGGVMMFFDDSVRKFYYKEVEDKVYADYLNKLDVEKRHEIRERISKWNKIVSDPNASERDKGTARGELKKLREEFGQNLSAI